MMPMNDKTTDFKDNGSLISNHMNSGRPDVKLHRVSKKVAERERENFICQVKTTIFNIIVNYNSRLPEKANAHQCWPPLTQYMNITK